VSSQLASDLVDDRSLRNTRADELSYRADRVREAAGAAALVGLIFAVLTARPSSATDGRREASSAAANTAANGTT
jgi:hypothetical protein